MEEMSLPDRVRHLEEEIEQLKTQPEPAVNQDWFIQAPQRILRFVVSHWALLSFLGALVVLVYAKVAFNVDYFEDYRNISTTKKLAEFYRRLGDRMMEEGEWTPAEEAYQAALEVNPNDIEATYGIVKAQVFQPPEGELYYAPEVAEVKLEYLLSLFPDDFQLYYLKGNQYLFQGDNENAELWFKKAVEKNPGFAAGYINLGYTNQRDSDFEEAISDFEKAIELDPNNALAHNNLGYLYLLTSRVELAVEHLETAYSLSPKLLTAINLGDAYRHLGHLNSALQWHQFAQFVLSESEDENERYIGGQWLFNFMPEEIGDLETIQQFVEVGSLKQKEIFLRYALSFDYALNGNLESADMEFEAGHQMDLSRQYDAFFINKILSIENSLDLEEDTLEWFEEHRFKLVFGP